MLQHIQALWILQWLEVTVQVNFCLASKVQKLTHYSTIDKTPFKIQKISWNNYNNKTIKMSSQGDKGKVCF